MSIISNALKKAQQNRSRNPQKKSPSLSLPVLDKNSSKTTRKNGKFLRYIIFSFVLFIVACLLVLAYFRLDLSEITFPKRPGINAPVSSISDKVIPSDTAIETNKTLFAKETDKFEIPVIPTTEQTLPVLNGIMYSSTSPQAIINGKLIAEGSKIGNFTVIKIHPEKVDLRSGNRDYELPLQ